MRLCCCLRCPSAADTCDSIGYLLCMFLIALPSADTHYSSGCLMCRVLLRIATLRILVAIEVEVAIYNLKGIAESGISEFQNFI